MSDVLISSLREITGDGDLECMLKSSIGGYTKKSVQDYLAYVKRQQQNLKDTYAEEHQCLQMENEALRAEKLKLEQENAQLAAKLSGSDDAREALAREERGKLEDEISRLAYECDMHKQELAIKDKAMCEQQARVEALARQEETNHGMLDRLQEELACLREELQCKESENAALAERLKIQTEECIEYCRENSRIKTSYALLQRRLESTQGRLQMAAIGIEPGSENK